MLVTIIIPAYKKEKTIKKDIEKIFNTMKETRWDFEIVVVDDGSPDKTFEEAGKFKRPNVFVYRYESNRGKGYAVRYGMARANGDPIVFIDSGMEINANGVSMILEHMQWYDADIVMGSKRHPASKVNQPLIRKIYSWGYHFLIKVLFHLRLKDTQTGLKVYKRKVLEDVLPRLLVKRFAFDIELLAVAHHLGYTRIYEAPVEIEWDFASSSFDKFLFLSPYIRGMLHDTLAVFYRIYILRYYDDSNKRLWKFDKELEMRINTGEMKKS